VGNLSVGMEDRSTDIVNEKYVNSGFGIVKLIYDKKYGTVMPTEGVGSDSLLLLHTATEICVKLAFFDAEIE
jgi:hypothetical protein